MAGNPAITELMVMCDNCWGADHVCDECEAMHDPSIQDKFLKKE